MIVMSAKEREIFKPRPFNENHTHFNCLAALFYTVNHYKCSNRHSNKCKTSGFTTACLECGFTTCLELTSVTTMLIAT